MRSCREPVPASIRILVAALATIVVVVAGVTSAGAQGSDPDAPVSSEQARAAVRDVMARPEFDYSPSTLERISEWIGEQLSKLFAPAETAAGGSFGGGIGTLFGWLIMLAAVAALVAVAVTVALGLAGTARALGQKPAPVLRNL